MLNAPFQVHSKHLEAGPAMYMVKPHPMIKSHPLAPHLAMYCCHCHWLNQAHWKKRTLLSFVQMHTWKNYSSLANVDFRGYHPVPWNR